MKRIKKWVVDLGLFDVLPIKKENLTDSQGIDNIDFYKTAIGRAIKKYSSINGKNLQVVKLIDICKFLPKTKHPASEGKDNGKYPFYTSSAIQNKFLDTCDFSEECIIIGDGGRANIHISKEFSATDHHHIITSCDKYNINLRYIYLYLLQNISVLEKGFKGSALKNISKDYVANIEIPIPIDDNGDYSMEIQNSIVREIEKIENYISKGQELLQELLQYKRAVLHNLLTPSIENGGLSADENESGAPYTYTHTHTHTHTRRTA